MRVLILGGSGLISVGIVKHLLTRGANVTVFNRGKRAGNQPAGVKHLVGDRNDRSFESFFAGKPFDVVIDMICYTPEQAQADVRAFATRCEHFIFCSTVCTYGVKVPPSVVIDETFPQEPISTYGKNKLACEQIFRRAEDSGKFNVTVIRPSNTYGPGTPLIDNLEMNPVSWDRIERGLPVLCSGGGLGLWTSTHRDDVGKLFAHAALSPTTFGKSYNATRQEVFTWRDYYRDAAAALGKRAKVIFMPASWIVAHDPQRFNLLHEITQYHGAYTSSAARRDVPQFECEVNFLDGAAETLRDARARGAWRSSQDDALYQSMIDQAQSAGVEAVEL
jgi:nucleoside-diphosphate-sugar epimerase